MKSDGREIRWEHRCVFSKLLWNKYQAAVPVNVRCRTTQIIRYWTTRKVKNQLQYCYSKTEWALRLVPSDKVSETEGSTEGRHALDSKEMNVQH